MGETNGIGREDRAAEEAADWFVRLQGDEATGDDWLTFEQWLRAAPANATAYSHIENVWVELDGRAAEIEEALDKPRALPRRARPLRPTVTRRAWLGAAGGAIAAGIVAAVVLRPTGTPVTTYVALPGQLREITLADGTHIHLNAASKITVSLGRDARRVTMDDAEAVFDVAHDPRRPFLITAGDQQVKVVGTRFDLRERERAMVLTISRGVVEVRPLREPDAAPTRLTVGQQFTHRDGEQTAVVRTVDPADAFGWTTGQLIYRDQPLSEVAADLTRRFGTTVRPADARVAQLRFTGVLVADNEAAVFHRLEAFAPIEAVRTTEGIILREHKVR
jgi:transmembrane sensor